MLKPVFVVTNRGRDVEQAANVWDALIKTFGLGPILKILSEFLSLLLQEIQNSRLFLILKEKIGVWLKGLEKVFKRIDPVLAFSLFPS